MKNYQIVKISLCFLNLPKKGVHRNYSEQTAKFLFDNVKEIQLAMRRTPNFTIEDLAYEFLDWPNMIDDIIKLSLAFPELSIIVENREKNGPLQKQRVFEKGEIIYESETSISDVIG